MSISNLAEVSVRLEEAVHASSRGQNLEDTELYDLYEQIAISILDSNFDHFPENQLEDYLRAYLSVKAESLLGSAHDSS